MNCDCGASRPYADCCGRYHAGPLHLQAPDAEALMRSRYSAYVRNLTDYLLDTWHSSTRPSVLEVHAPGLRWLGLEVRRHTVQDADHATVEFVARSKLTQINARNFARLGLDATSALDPCRNLAAMQVVLSECLRRHGAAEQQLALRRALSCYYSGNAVTGFRHGYVQHVVAASQRPPAPRLHLTTN